MTENRILVCRHIQTREKPAEVLCGEDGVVSFAVCFTCASALDDESVDATSAFITHCKAICPKHAAKMGVPDTMPGPAPFYAFNSDDKIWVDATA